MVCCNRPNEQHEASGQLPFQRHCVFAHVQAQAPAKQSDAGRYTEIQRASPSLPVMSSSTLNGIEPGLWLSANATQYLLPEPAQARITVRTLMPYQPVGKAQLVRRQWQPCQSARSRQSLGGDTGQQHHAV